ncbi:hypothetical protein [Caviibacterium pharyngocola]|uniref:UvrD-like helicase C-terminal domain-containing protein n=1 Tax=Caviibacterium pharyngocola TaxID=28159 RepID=A0A2M8RYV6_9PAST|nr:hypothetical protein [Caviibacterium pharyngocola]PJG84054.1 hypothetical protein CVP04_00965 [Caviibacterium pharyngocola]
MHKIKKETNADMGVKGAGAGIDIIEIKNVQLLLLENVLQNQITQFQQEGINDYQITILTDEQLAWDIKAYLPHSVQALDDFSIQSFPISYISFATATNFKGLENDVIIFIHKGKNLLSNKNLSYVAMSRAKSILVIIYLVE